MIPLHVSLKRMVSHLNSTRATHESINSTTHVVEITAFKLDASPNLSIEEIEFILKQTTSPLGLFHPNDTYGWGLVNAPETVSKVTL
ncbi:MAG: hypothetical protein AMJ42_03945 [Deltaproteobacteria bacterium DG_8]|nr:MAG: hypothetical protein AMJ42_03945 [Deltaproteobacteria bacterium DG_8]